MENPVRFFQKFSSYWPRLPILIPIMMKIENSSISLVVDAMQQLLSPRQFAEAIGVSESSVRRWADTGRIKMTRTAGGLKWSPKTGQPDKVE
jgi:hypothetical protein